MSPLDFLQRPDSLAQCDVEVRRHRERRPELRVRPGCPQGYVRTESQPGPEPLEGRVQRRRAGAPRDDRAVQRGIRRVRLPQGSLLRLLRPGRGDADGDRRNGPDAARLRHGRRATALGDGRAVPAGDGRAGCPAARRLRRRAARRRRGDRRARLVPALPGRGRRRNLGLQPERRAGILAETGGEPSARSAERSTATAAATSARAIWATSTKPVISLWQAASRT